MLKTHGRQDYRAIVECPCFIGPGDKGLTVDVALDIEHCALAEGMVEALVPDGHDPNVLNYWCGSSDLNQEANCKTEAELEAEAGKVQQTSYVT